MSFGDGEGAIAREKKKEHKEVQTECRVEEKSTQTNITMVSTWYDPLFMNIETIDEVVKELIMREKVMQALTAENIMEKDLENEELAMEKLNKIVADVSALDMNEESNYVPQLKLELGFDKTEKRKMSIINSPNHLSVNQLRKSSTMVLPKISVISEQGVTEKKENNEQPKHTAINYENKIVFNPTQSPMMSRHGSMLMEEMVNMTEGGDNAYDRLGFASPSMLSFERKSLTKLDALTLDFPLSPQLSTDWRSNLSIPKTLAVYTSSRDSKNDEIDENPQLLLSPKKSNPEFKICVNQTEPTLTVDGCQAAPLSSVKETLEPIEEEAERNESNHTPSPNHEKASDNFDLDIKDEPQKRREDFRRYKSSDVNSIPQGNSGINFSVQPVPLHGTSSSNQMQTDTMSVEKASCNLDLPQDQRPLIFQRSDSIGASGSKVALIQKLTFEINKSMLLTKRLQQEKLQNAALQKSKAADKFHIEEVLVKVEEKDQVIRRLEEELKKFRESRVAVSESLEDSEDDSPELEEQIRRKNEKKERALRNKEEKKIIAEQLLKNYASLEEKYNQNSARNLISKLNLGKFANFKNPMSLKTVMRTIYTLYTDRMEELSLKPETRHLPLCEYVYNYYLQVFGIKTISEKKFTYFILSLKVHAQYFRVNLFSRFMGLVENQKYDDDLVDLYFEGMLFFETSTKGYPIKNKDTSVRFFYPYTRGIDFLQQMFGDKLPRTELLEFRKSVDKLREPDPNSLNSAIVDIDLFMEKVIDKYAVLVNGNKQYVIDAFKACDLDGNNACSVNEFLLLNRYIEPSNFELSCCIKRFFDNADTLTDKERTMSFNKFAVVCTNFNLFSDKSQKEFLKVKDENDLEMLYHRLQKNWLVNYSGLSSKLAAFESLTPEETTNWRTILDVLNTRMAVDTAVEIKPTLIALKMTELEFERIKEEDEIVDDQDDNDITKIVSKRAIPGGLRDSFGSRMLPVILQEI